jgi:hypothetical protein
VEILDVAVGKAVSDKRLSPRRGGCQADWGQRRPDGRTSRDAGGGRFWTPPIKVVQRACRGFLESLRRSRERACQAGFRGVAVFNDSGGQLLTARK